MSTAAKYADLDSRMWMAARPNAVRHNARGWYYLNCTLPWDDYQRPGDMFMRNTGWRAAGGTQHG